MHFVSVRALIPPCPLALCSVPCVQLCTALRFHTPLHPALTFQVLQFSCSKLNSQVLEAVLSMFLLWRPILVPQVPSQDSTELTSIASTSAICFLSFPCTVWGELPVLLLSDFAVIDGSWALLSEAEEIWGMKGLIHIIQQPPPWLTQE